MFSGHDCGGAQSTGGGDGLDWTLSVTSEHRLGRTWALRPPREVQERTLRLDRAAQRLSQQLRRPPTIGEFASAIGDSDEEVLEALQARSGDFLSLQALAGSDAAHRALQERVGAPDGGYAEAEHRMMLDTLLAFLPPRHRMIVRLRFEHDLSQAEIGSLLNVTQMHISRTLRDAMERLRTVAQQQQRLEDRRRRALCSTIAT